MNQKEKYFIERLTHTQITNFIEELYPKTNGFTFSIYSQCNSNTPCICVSVIHPRNNFKTIIQLEDFSAHNISNSTNWLKYLQKIFGDEYVKSYIEKCLSIFDDVDEH